MTSIPDPRHIYESIYRSQSEEQARPVRATEGTIPAELEGSMVRIGPGKLSSGRDPLHFFDGHGLVAAITFRDGEAYFRSRHVRTATFEAEERAGRMVHRRVFTNLPSRWSNAFTLPSGNNAAHDVYAWGGKLVAAEDPGHWALDPRTLDTLGRESWDGVKKGQIQSPMPRVDLSRDRLVAYRITPGGLSPDTITFLELDGSMKALDRRDEKLAASPAFVHDLAFTDRWYVTFEWPARLSVPGVLWGAKTVYECIAWKGTPTLLLVPRGGDASREAVRVPMPEPLAVIFHILNAYDDGESVVVDCVGYDSEVDFPSLSGVELREKLGRGHRTLAGVHVLRIRADHAGGAARVTPIAELVGELPEVDPRVFGKPYRFAWLATPAERHRNPPDPLAFPWFHGIAKLDVESGESRVWSAGPDAFVSQPVLASRPGGVDEDDGWVLTFVLQPHQNRVEAVILDARDPSSGPVARIDLESWLPGSSHCLYSREVDVFPQ